MLSGTLLKPVSSVEAFYAKLLIKYSAGTRLKFYRKLAALLRNRFSVMDSLDRMHAIESEEGKNLGEPVAIAIRVWANLIQNGVSFSTALKGWAPPRERLMLSVGDISHLEDALMNVIKVSEGSAKMIGPLIGAMLYPLFLFTLTFAIIVMVGIYMVPPMAEAVPNPETFEWKGTAASLVSMSYFVQNWWYIFPVSVISFIVIFVQSLPNWRGFIRVKLDKFPPWSMYRIFTGVGFLLSLAALVRAGTPISQALHSLRTDATPYLLARIDRTLAYVSNGDNLGTALYNTKQDFPDKELIGDLRIYAELDRFEDTLDQLADEWLETSVDKINKQATILNVSAILIVSLTIAWVVFGTFEMQMQVTSKF